MKTPKRLVLGGISFMLRVFRRPRVFPFSLFYMLLGALLRMIELWRGRRVTGMGEAGGGAADLPRNVLVWLDRVAAGVVERPFDVCLRLPRDAADANLQEVFSILLTSPRLRSIGLYWDEAGLAEDFPIWQGRPDRHGGAALVELRDHVGALGFQQMRKFFEAEHEGLALPVAAARDAQTLLKRQAPWDYVVCLNVPAEVRALVDAAVATLPDLRFFDLEPDAPPCDVVNLVSLAGYGLNLHERLALVQAADAYVGRFDELGCAALVSGRPTVLLGGGADGLPASLRRGDVALWYPSLTALPGATEVVLRFVRRHLPGELASQGRPYGS